MLDKNDSKSIMEELCTVVVLFTDFNRYYKKKRNGKGGGFGR